MRPRAQSRGRGPLRRLRVWYIVNNTTPLQYEILRRGEASAIAARSARHAATPQHHAALCSRRRLPALQLRAAGIAASTHPTGIAASCNSRCAGCQRGSDAELGGTAESQHPHRASGIGSVLAPARRDAVGCARHLARLRLRSGAGQPAGSASADPAGSWQGQPRLCGCGGRGERSAGDAGPGGGMCSGGGGDRRRVTAALGWAPPSLSLSCSHALTLSPRRHTAWLHSLPTRLAHAHVHPCVQVAAARSRSSRCGCGCSRRGRPPLPRRCSSRSTRPHATSRTRSASAGGSCRRGWRAPPRRRRRTGARPRCCCARVARWCAAAAYS